MAATIIQCKQCGKGFSVLHPTPRKKFCSRACLSQSRVKRYVSDTERKCLTCGLAKHISEFDGFISTKLRTFGKKYLFGNCKTCRPEVARKARYGVTLAEMIAQQGTALCPLCKVRMVNCVDHDHKTGKPRGALCRKCNLIMHYMDDFGWVSRAKEYVAASLGA